MSNPTRITSSPVPVHAKWWCFAGLLCCLIYLRGLFGEFLFDDFGNIIGNSALRNLDGTAPGWKALLLSSDAGPLHRPISMLTFGANYMLFGFRPLGFKLTNLAIHLLNGWLVFVLGKHLVARLLPSAARSRDSATPPEWIAFFVATLWLLHPLNVSSVLYVVQRMNELSALFSLAGLICYVDGRQRMLRGTPGAMRAIVGLGGFTLLSVLSKENGALTFAYALAIEATCFGFKASSAHEQRTIRTFFVITVAIPAMMFVGYVATHSQWLLNGYASRDFTFTERVLSEPLFLCRYLLWIVLPLPSWLGIFHDDIPTSTGLLHPPTTLAAILFLVATVVVAWTQRTKRPGLSFAVAWFLIGHSMESSILPLELVYEHRNYLPMAGLLMGLTCTVAPWIQARLSHRHLAIAATLVLVVAGALTAVRANDWRSQLSLALSEAKHHPDSSRAQYEAGRSIIFDGTAAGKKREAEARAIPYFERGMALDPTDVFSATGLVMIHGTRGDLTDALINDLANRLHTLKWPQISPFLAMQTAATEQVISVDSAQMQRLTEAVLGNPHFPTSLRAIVLDNYGHYLFAVSHDPQAAVSMTLAAAAMDPMNARYQVNLAKLALTLGEKDRAWNYLKNARDLDKGGVYADVITALENQTPLQ